MCAVSNSSILKLADVTAYYGKSQALFGVSLEVPSRGTVAILGRNGAGKTTLLNTIAGELPCRTGEIALAGEAIQAMPTHRRARAGIGYVPQDQVAFSKLTVIENLQVGAIRAKNKSFDKVLEVFPKLRTRLKQPAGTLSGGERKMLGIARALLGEPSILMLDEPTEGVWIGVVEEIGDRLNYLSNEMAVLIVEQNLEMALRIATKVYVMDRGAVALSGTADAVRDSAELVRLLAP
jgi:branched-chain amino acid transport system ATP-binding protein